MSENLSQYLAVACQGGPAQMRVKLGSVAFLRAAGSGYGIGLNDDGQLIEFLGDWRALETLRPELAGPTAVYVDVEDWAVIGIDDEPRIPFTPAGMAERAQFVKAALAAMDDKR